MKFLHNYNKTKGDRIFKGCVCWKPALTKKIKLIKLDAIREKIIISIKINVDLLMQEGLEIWMMGMKTGICIELMRKPQKKLEVKRIIGSDLSMQSINGIYS